MGIRVRAFILTTRAARVCTRCGAEVDASGRYRSGDPHPCKSPSGLKDDAVRIWVDLEAQIIGLDEIEMTATVGGQEFELSTEERVIARAKAITKLTESAA